MKQRYLLSTGLVTNKIEYYIIDLFKLHLSIYPKDIPGAEDIGFDFIITNTKKDELYLEVNTRIQELINKFKKKFSGINIKLEDSTLIDETKLKLTISVNEVFDTISIDL